MFTNATAGSSAQYTFFDKLPNRPYAARLLDMLSYYSDPDHAYQDVGVMLTLDRITFGFKILTLLTIVIGSLILSVFLHLTAFFRITIVTGKQIGRAHV